MFPPASQAVFGSSAAGLADDGSPGEPVIQIGGDEMSFDLAACRQASPTDPPKPLHRRAPSASKELSGLLASADAFAIPRAPPSRR